MKQLLGGGNCFLCQFKADRICGLKIIRIVIGGAPPPKKKIKNMS